MNHLQKAWLKALGPVVTLVNDKMAKRSGLIGKLGKFFAFGPRQFGYHPINRYLALINRVYLQSIPLALHRYSFIKYHTNNSDIWMKMDILALVPMQFHLSWVWLSFLVPYSSWPSQVNSTRNSTINIKFRGTTLETLTKAGLPAHYSSLNDRVSAHYTEINSLYQWEMLKRVTLFLCSLKKEWKILNDQDQLKPIKLKRPNIQGKATITLNPILKLYEHSK